MFGGRNSLERLGPSTGWSLSRRPELRSSPLPQFTHNPYSWHSVVLATRGAGLRLYEYDYMRLMGKGLV